MIKLEFSDLILFAKEYLTLPLEFIGSECVNCCILNVIRSALGFATLKAAALELFLRQDMLMAGKKNQVNSTRRCQSTAAKGKNNDNANCSKTDRLIFYSQLACYLSATVPSRAIDCSVVRINIVENCDKHLGSRNEEHCIWGTTKGALQFGDQQ